MKNLLNYYEDIAYYFDGRLWFLWTIIFVFFTIWNIGIICAFIGLFQEK